MLITTNFVLLGLGVAATALIALLVYTLALWWYEQYTSSLTEAEQVFMYKNKPEGNNDNTNKPKPNQPSDGTWTIWD